MMTKTGSWLVLSTLAVTALWAAPAQANTCDENYGYCMDNASSESDRWVQEHLWDSCAREYEICLSAPTECGDYFCGNGEDQWVCPEDCS